MDSTNKDLFLNPFPEPSVWIEVVNRVFNKFLLKPQIELLLTEESPSYKTLDQIGQFLTGRKYVSPMDFATDIRLLLMESAAKSSTSSQRLALQEFERWFNRKMKKVPISRYEATVLQFEKVSRNIDIVSRAMSPFVTIPSVKLNSNKAHKFLYHPSKTNELIKELQRQINAVKKPEVLNEIALILRKYGYSPTPGQDQTIVPDKMTQECFNELFDALR